MQEAIDVSLTEINVDSLKQDTIKLVIDANGTISDLKEGVDYTVVEKSGENEWHRYDYIIDKSVFDGDGRYILTLYSEDEAGNINENIDERKEAQITFGIDKTAPVIIPIDIESATQYAVDGKRATITVNDNLVLEEVQIFVEEKQTEYIVDGENYVFDVPSSNEPQDIAIIAIDAAGNRTSYIISDVLVTTNAFIRWYNNAPLFIGSILGAAVTGGFGFGLLRLHRSGRKK